MTIHEDEFPSLNEQGLIPGPEETEEDFTKRTRYCLNLNRELVQQCELPSPIDSQTSQSLLNAISPFVKKAYGFSPNWVPIIFSNHQLAPWHGGCAWIFQVTHESPLGALFQLRKAFLHSQRYLGIYNRDELMIHEAAHIGRMAFQEPNFEELLAYQSSNSAFRKWFGPIISSPKESLYFVLSCFLAFAGTFYYTFLDGPPFLNWLFILPLFLMMIGLLRLVIRHYQLKKCLKAIEALLKDKEIASHVVYRLSDSEIISFGSKTENEIESYIKSQMPTSLRWRFIKAIYLRNLGT